MTFSKFPISNANSATETIETLSARSIFYPFFVDPLRGTISLGKNGEEEIKVTIRGILIGGVISPGDLSICHRGGGGRGIRDYSSKKYGPRFMGRFRSPFPERDTCIWTNFAGVWSHVRVESRRGPYIIQSFSHRPPPPSRRIAWIPVRGRRVNISPHVKPRAGKNVSTWVPCLVLDAPFAPFLPRPSPSLLPYLSIFRRRAAASFLAARPEEESSRGEGRRKREGNVAERDGWTVPCFCAVFKSG